MPTTTPHLPTTPCGDLRFPKQPPVQLSLPQLWPDLDLSYDEAYQLEERTREQIHSDEWFACRRRRITASDFHKVYTRKKAVDMKFLKRLYDPTKFYSEPTAHGIKHETTAKQQFILKYPNHHLHNIGLVVNPQFPFLGASPDAKVCVDGETAIIEIKCPFTARDKTVAEACEDNSFCLMKDQANEYQLRQNHEYWLQVQGQLLVTGAPFCLFIVCTSKDMQVIRVIPHLDTMSMLLGRLTDFYKKHPASEYLNSIAANSDIEPD